MINRREIFERWQIVKRALRALTAKDKYDQSEDVEVLLEVGWDIGYCVCRRDSKIAVKGIKS